MINTNNNLMYEIKQNSFFGITSDRDLDFAVNINNIVGKMNSVLLCYPTSQIVIKHILLSIKTFF